MKIKIEKTGINGEGIGYVENKPIFIMGALPQEEVEVEELVDFKTYHKAKLKRIIKRSPDRAEVICPIQKRCGGCALMDANYDAQVRIKQEHLRQSLQKYQVNLSKTHIPSPIKNPDPLYYRNQLKMPIQRIDGVVQAGFYARETNHFVPVETCFTHTKALERLKNDVMAIINQYRLRTFKEDQKGLRTLVIREVSGVAQVTLITGELDLSPKLIEALMQVEGLVSLGQSIQTKKRPIDPFGKEWKLLGGEASLKFKFMSMDIRLKAKAFFQLNTSQAEVLFQEVLNHIDADMKVADVYCGVGALSLAIAKKAKQVTGIELNKEAIESAQLNAKLNKISNIKFIKGNAATELSKISKHLDCIVVDPPRAGLDDDMIELFMTLRIRHLIYVSCNPSTLAKNLAVLQKNYHIEHIQSLDMFSQTPLIESVVVLKHKNAYKRQAD